jgi:7-cyano-7-deazaguanine synthase in queuosine biosynthesis
VDDILVSAFFRPPEELAEKMGRREASLLAIPILCDLAAEVRPNEISVPRECPIPNCRQIFDDAVGALLADQDAYWQKPSFTPMPTLQGKFTRWKSEPRRLDRKRVVLGFSGGKDSVVSLFALLKAGYNVHPVLLNEGDRTWQDLRRWIPKLRGQGLRPVVAYLSTGRRNGLQKCYGDWHYSSYQLGWVLAVLALCAAALRARTICLGIEASADRSFATFRGRRFNHQYQKTTRHLRTLERFYQRVLNPELRIGSPIAHLTDTEVLKVLLERVPRAFQEFSSCGGSNWQSKHCGKCEKCAFVYALLSASARGRRLAGRTFRRDLLEDVELYRPWIDARFRPPQACVGSRSEVWTALETLLEAGSNQAVVRMWGRSWLRRRMLMATVERDSHRPVKDAGSPLSPAVEDAAALVREWISL